MILHGSNAASVGKSAMVMLLLLDGMLVVCNLSHTTRDHPMSPEESGNRFGLERRFEDLG